MTKLPADAYCDLVRPMEVAVSPSGDTAAFTAFECDREANARRSSVFTVPTDGSSEPYRLTRVSDGSTMKWSPDGTRLGVITTRERDTELQVGSESLDQDDPTPQLWVFDIERGGDPRQITTHEEGIADFDWGPAGESVVVSARDPTDDQREYLANRQAGGPIESERLQHKFDGTGWLDDVSTYLFVVDVDTRETRRLDNAYSGGILQSFNGLQPRWHPTDDTIAFIAHYGKDGDDTYAQDLHLVDADSGETAQLTDGGLMISQPRWSPDGSQLAAIVNNPTKWYIPAEIQIIDPETAASRSVTSALDRDLAWFEQYVWLNDDQLLAAIGDEGWSRFVRISASGDHERVFGWQSRDSSLVQFDANGETIAYIRQHAQNGIDLFSISEAALNATDGVTDPRQQLTTLNPELVSEYDHPSIRRVTFDGANDDTVEGIAFLPPDFDPDTPNAETPLLLSIHGGPRRYDEPHFDFGTAYWTTRGYLVFKVNYHGSTSYGREFCEALMGNWNDIDAQDLLAGTSALVERGWVDPDRLFVKGFSTGGRLTAELLTQTDRFAAGAAEHGTYDARAAFGSDDSQQWWENELGLPWENPTAYDDTSPITDVDKIETPLALIAGEADLRCPPWQAEKLHVSLQKRGVDSKIVVYPETSHVHHFIARPERAIHRLETLADWFSRFDPARE